MALRRYDGRVRNGRWKRLKGRRATRNQVEFVKAYVANGGNGAQAVVDVYGQKDRKIASKMAHNTLRSEAVRPILEAEMKRHGITADAALLPIKNALEAKVVHEGAETEAPDHKARLKASDMALNLMDAYPKKDDGGVREAHWHQHVHFEEPVEVTRFIVTHGRRPTDEETAKLLTEGSDEQN